MEIDFKNLKILQMFLWNKGNLDFFIEAMETRYGNDHGYINNLWPSFRDNPIGFLVTRNETEVFDYIMKVIKDTKYKG